MPTHTKPRFGYISKSDFIKVNGPLFGGSTCCLVVQQVGIKNVKACSHQRGRECFSKPVELSIRAAQRTELNQLMRVKTPSILFMYRHHLGRTVQYEHHRIGGLGQYEDDSLTTF